MEMDFLCRRTILSRSIFRLQGIWVFLATSLECTILSLSNFERQCTQFYRGVLLDPKDHNFNMGYFWTPSFFNDIICVSARFYHWVISTPVERDFQCRYAILPQGTFRPQRPQFYYGVLLYSKFFFERYNLSAQFYRCVISTPDTRFFTMWWYF